MSFDVVKFCGLSFKGVTRSILLRESEYLKLIITVNAEFIVEAYKDKKFMAIINDNYSTFDGQVPYFFSKLLSPHDAEKISGSDFIYDVIDRCKATGQTIFLLGDNRVNNRAAVEYVKEKFGVNCVGFSPTFEPYPFSKQNDMQIRSELEKVNIDYLFVGFGAKKQEFWMSDNYDYLQSLGIRAAVGCGGTFGFLSQNIKRAPVIIQRMGLEGFFRFVKEPKLFRFRRLIKSFVFFKYIFKK
ncbi:WecB/TagA/CpsF family glycosyltransferase [Shewanella rhizosphaerae]|uniref:WecB/TagA/CpsF family glycosyltransferase n=1 Tax=Shewanella rhizosphaerae TaxID=2864207 RepID=UPI001C65C219|nr:WecB/TagA/CpsF family glycosyltransferase [Shewanella rhizosphaerae]QYK14262.1 WecB/TagA/CpsF family glycosyltransferase [Shewanella rhizosphaerae]